MVSYSTWQLVDWLLCLIPVPRGRIRPWLVWEVGAEAPALTTLWPQAIRGILQEMFSTGGRIQTLCHTRNSGSKALRKGNPRHSVGAPLRLLQGKEISGNSLQTNMLLWSWLHRIIRGICSLTDEPVRHMGCRWLTPCLPPSHLTETQPEPLLPLHPLAKPQGKYSVIKMVPLPRHSPRKLHPKCTEISPPTPIIKLNPRSHKNTGWPHNR